MVNTRSTKGIPAIGPRKTISARPQNATFLSNALKNRVKRKAESPAKNVTVKRSAFGDITNAMKAINVQDTKPVLVKKVTVQTKVLPTLRTVVRPKEIEKAQPPALPQKKIVTRASLKNTVPYAAETVQKPKESLKIEQRIKTRLSNEFDKTEDSLYTSALENICDSAKSVKFTEPSRDTAVSPAKKIKLEAKSSTNIEYNIGNHSVPEDILDFDKENWNDVFQVSHYAMDIFNYMKNREQQFIIKPYMDRQVCLTTWMRSLLVDWMVEVQESFELNHETLYLGVKLVDYYLSRVIVSKETLQLVGAAAMFIASKYDERIPPLIDDFLYICDGAYSRRELIRMEMNVLKICDFNLGIPLSYRYLRRYARCAKVSMPILTLARYILEFSLMDYAIVHLSDSKLAAAAMYLALRMKNVSDWTPTLEFYTGYKLDDILSIVIVLNNGLHRKPKEQLSTVRNKYSHKIFFQVAKTELISNDLLK